MAPERLNGSNYSYGADIWQATMAQSGLLAAPQLGSPMAARTSSDGPTGC